MLNAWFGLLPAGAMPLHHRLDAHIRPFVPDKFDAGHLLTDFPKFLWNKWLTHASY